MSTATAYNHYPQRAHPHSSGSGIHRDPPPSLESHRDSTGSAASYAYPSYSSSNSGQGIRKRMTSTIRASNKAAILSVGEELRVLLHEEDPPLIKDRRYHLTKYETCFVGYDMVDWLLKKGEVESRKEAVAMMQKLLDNGVIHHVCDDHDFKDDKLFYRFRKDDGTYQEPPGAAILARGQRIYGRIRGDGSTLIQDRKYHLKTYQNCFIGKELVDWLLAKNEAQSREEAIDIGKQLLDAGIFKHVCDDHHFKDEHLFYRFKNDEKHKHSPRLKDRLGSGKKNSKKFDDSGSTGDSNENRASGSSWDSSFSETPPRGTPELDEYVHMQSHQQPPKVPSPLPSRVTGAPTSNLPMSSHSPPSTDIKTNGVSPPSLTTTAQRVRPTIEELTNPNGKYMKRSVDVTSDPVGYGFVIRGSRPVYVHTIDPSGPAAAAGLQVNEYLYSVNGQVVLNSSHTDAARIILMGPSTASLVTFVERDR